MNKIIQGDALTKLKELPDESIDCVMTSPPYWALRDYGTGGIVWDDNPDCEHEWGEKIITKERGDAACGNTGNHSKRIKGQEEKQQHGNYCQKCGAWKGELGLEPTFDLYIKHLCDVFDKVKRVLKKSGTCFVNIGDTYSSAPTGNKGHIKNELFEGTPKGDDYRDKIANATKNKPKTRIKEKSLTMIPFRFAIEMVNRGWILRNTIIWHKSNCMPSSIKDRFTVDFEYLFFFSKNKKYYFEQQFEELAESTKKDKRLDKGLVKHKSGKSNKDDCQYAIKGMCANSKGRNKRTVWNINSKPFKEAHFAVFPEELVETPLKAGCPKEVCKKCGKPKKLNIESQTQEKKKNVFLNTKYKNVKEEKLVRQGFDSSRIWKNPIRKNKGYYPTCKCNEGFESGIVLDPFFGSGTTGLVALKQGKKFIGIELNKEYIDIAKKRLKPYLEQKSL